MPADVTSEQTDGTTPAGGAYAVANFLDAEMKPCTKDKAAHIEILEFDQDGKNIARTWLERSEPGQGRHPNSEVPQ